MENNKVLFFILAVFALNYLIIDTVKDIDFSDEQNHGFIKNYIFVRQIGMVLYYAEKFKNVSIFSFAIILSSMISFISMVRIYFK